MAQPDTSSRKPLDNARASDLGQSYASSSWSSDFDPK
jgi:hypothetical protein